MGGKMSQLALGGRGKFENSSLFFLADKDSSSIVGINFRDFYGVGKQMLHERN